MSSVQNEEAAVLSILSELANDVAATGYLDAAQPSSGESVLSQLIANAKGGALSSVAALDQCFRRLEQAMQSAVSSNAEARQCLDAFFARAHALTAAPVPAPTAPRCDSDSAAPRTKRAIKVPVKLGQSFYDDFDLGSDDDEKPAKREEHDNETGMLPPGTAGNSAAFAVGMSAAATFPAPSAGAPSTPSVPAPVLQPTAKRSATGGAAAARVPKVRRICASEERREATVRPVPSPSTNPATVTPIVRLGDLVNARPSTCTSYDESGRDGSMSSEVPVRSLTQGPFASFLPSSDSSDATLSASQSQLLTWAHASHTKPSSCVRQTHIKRGVAMAAQLDALRPLLLHETHATDVSTAPVLAQTVGSSTSKDAIDHVLDVQAQLLTSLRAAKEERLCRGDAETSHEEQVIAGALQRSLAHLVGQTSTRLSDLVSPPSIPSSSAHYSMLVCIAQAVQKRRTNTDHAAAAPASAADESSTAEAPMSSSEGTDKTALAQCTNCCVLDTPAWHQGLTADSLLCHACYNYFECCGSARPVKFLPRIQDVTK